MYDYVRRTYGVDPQVGQPVELKNYPPGKVANENPGQAHYVMVRFEGWDHDAPVHPTDLTYLPRPGESLEARAAKASFERNPDHVAVPGMRRSIHRSHRGEGFNNID